MLTDDEVLVAPIIEEEAGHGRLVGIDDVNAQFPEGEVGCRAFRRVPETDGLPSGMRRGDGRVHGVQFRVDHPALAVPLLRELSEVRAEHPHPRQFVRRVPDDEVRIQVTIEENPVRIGRKVLVTRCIARNDHFHAVVGTEDVRVLAQQFHHLGEGGLRG